MTREKLQESIDLHLSELVADHLFKRINEELEQKWRTVIDELVSTRRTHEQLKTHVETLEANLTRIEHHMQQQEDTIKHTQETQRKAAKLIDEALSQLGAGSE